MNNYFNYDYWGHDKKSFTRQDLAESIQRLIDDLPEEIELTSLEFGLDHQWDRGDYEGDGYYIAWVTERSKDDCN